MESKDDITTQLGWAVIGSGRTTFWHGCGAVSSSDTSLVSDAILDDNDPGGAVEALVDGAQEAIARAADPDRAIEVFLVLIPEHADRGFQSMAITLE